MPNQVDQAPAWHKEDEDRHELARALRSGKPAMAKHAENKKYMYPNPGELKVIEGAEGGGSATYYNVRVERSFLLNGWAESIRDMGALAFKTSPQLEGWDDEIQGVYNEETKTNEGGWVDNWSQGRSFHDWAARGFEDSMFEGIVFDFIDLDPRAFNTSADRKDAKARPIITTFKRKDCWHFERQGESGETELGAVVLAQPKYHLDYANPNAWNEEVQRSFKVVLAPQIGAEPGTDEGLVRTFVYDEEKKKGGGSEFILKDSGFIRPVSGALSEIPLVPRYANRTDFFRGECPYLDTAWIQNAIWNGASEFQDLVRKVCLAKLTIAGADSKRDPHGKKVLDLRSDLEVLWTTKPEAEFGVLQIDPSSLGAVREYIEWLLDNIRKLHRQIASQKPRGGPVTAREVGVEAVHASSRLEMWLTLHEAAWQKTLEFVALLAGLPKRGTVHINKDIALPREGMDTLWDAYIKSEGRLVSPDIAWKEAKRHQWIDEKTDVKEIVEYVTDQLAREEQ